MMTQLFTSHISNIVLILSYLHLYCLSLWIMWIIIAVMICYILKAIVYVMSYCNISLYLVAFVLFVCCCFLYYKTPASGLLIYLVTDMKFYMFICFLLQYAYMCIFIEIMK